MGILGMFRLALASRGLSSRGAQHDKLEAACGYRISKVETWHCHVELLILENLQGSESETRQCRVSTRNFFPAHIIEGVVSL